MREGVGLVLCRDKEQPDVITRLDRVERARVTSWENEERPNEERRVMSCEATPSCLPSTARTSSIANLRALEWAATNFEAVDSFCCLSVDIFVHIPSFSVHTSLFFQSSPVLFFLP